MKIASFNINNVNKRLANLLGWLEISHPDVVCLQELKAEGLPFLSRALRRRQHESTSVTAERIFSARGVDPVKYSPEASNPRAIRPARL